MIPYLISFAFLLLSCAPDEDRTSGPMTPLTGGSSGKQASSGGLSIGIDTASLSSVMSTNQGQVLTEDNRTPQDEIADIQYELKVIGQLYQGTSNQADFQERLQNSPYLKLASDAIETLKQNIEQNDVSAALKNLKEARESLMALTSELQTVDTMGYLSGGSSNTASLGLSDSGRPSGTCRAKTVEPPREFSDPEVGAWAESTGGWRETRQYSLHALERGVISGTIENGKRMLKPGSSVKRGELASVYSNLFFALCKPKNSTQLKEWWDHAERMYPVKDAAPGAWYRVHMSRAVTFGLFAKSDSNTYRGEDAATAKEMGYGMAGVARALSKYCHGDTGGKFLPEQREAAFTACKPILSKSALVAAAFTDQTINQNVANVMGSRYQMAALTGAMLQCLSPVFCK